MSFQFVEKEVRSAPESEYKTTCYTWKIDVEHFFKGCNLLEVFPMAVNLYLKICSEQEHAELLDGEHFLRIQCYEYEKESRIQIMNLTLKDLDANKYEILLGSCREDMIPCEFNLGPFWHFFGINSTMCQERNLHMGWVMPSGYVRGSILYGRDAFPGETEESIRRTEIDDEIFIIRDEQRGSH